MGIVIHRSRHAQQYVVVPNAIARNTRLSFRARGLLVMLLSLPPEWHVTTDRLAEDNPDSRTAVRDAMVELRQAGYVQLLSERGRDGRTRRHLEVFDTPQPNADTPRLVLPAQTCIPAGRTKGQIPAVGKPAVGNTAVDVSTVPKYGPEVRGDRSVASSHKPRAHDGSNNGHLPPTPLGETTAVGEQPQTVTRARGTCPHCGRDMSLTRSGTIRRHLDGSTARGYCHGSGELPAQVAP